MPRRIPRNPIERFLDDLQGVFVGLVEDTMDDLRGRAPEYAPFPKGPNPLPKPRKGTKRNRPPNHANYVPVEGPTFYDALEVSPRASPETITAAFRSLGRRFHADNFPGKPYPKAAAERMAKVTEAYATLKDERKRREYDRKIGVGK